MPSAEAKATHGSDAVPLQIAGFVCPQQHEQFLATPNALPRIAAHESAVARMSLLTPRKLKPQGSDVALGVDVPPGSYVFAVSWPFGGATFTADVLAGHPRHVNVAVCNIMHLRESHRSVYGVLPGAGYAVTVDYPSGSVPASVDGGAYYAAGLPPGALTVRLYLSSDAQQYCDFRVSQGSDDWADEHIRYDISASTIHSSRSCKF